MVDSSTDMTIMCEELGFKTRASVEDEYTRLHKIAQADLTTKLDDLMQASVANHPVTDDDCAGQGYLTTDEYNTACVACSDICVAPASLGTEGCQPVPHRRGAVFDPSTGYCNQVDDGAEYVSLEACHDEHFHKGCIRGKAVPPSSYDIHGAKAFNRPAFVAYASKQIADNLWNRGYKYLNFERDFAIEPGQNPAGFVCPMNYGIPGSQSACGNGGVNCQQHYPADSDYGECDFTGGPPAICDSTGRRYCCGGKNICDRQAAADCPGDNHLNKCACPVPKYHNDGWTVDDVQMMTNVCTEGMTTVPVNHKPSDAVSRMGVCKCGQGPGLGGSISASNTFGVQCDLYEGAHPDPIVISTTSCGADAWNSENLNTCLEDSLTVRDVNKTYSTKNIFI
jgi:hypothetical protein